MYRVKRELAGRTISLEEGGVARQADGGVLVRYGDTVVLVSAVYSREPVKSSDLFLPLTVDYREQAFAAGKIPGGFFKREGRPHDKEILTSRLIDRPIRPLFPPGFCQETQITGFLLSSDLENDADLLGILGASAALTISEIPFGGPVAAVRIGKIDSQLVVNPTIPQRERSSLDLVVCGTRDTIIMLEGDGKEVGEEELVMALRMAQEGIGLLIELQEELKGLVGRKKISIPGVSIPEELAQRVRELSMDRIPSILDLSQKADRRVAASRLKRELAEPWLTSHPEAESLVAQVLDELFRKEVRRRILEEDRRLDGRRHSDLRPIACEVGVLPRTHGSALFSRGQTQCLAVVTLGTKRDEQFIDDVEWEGYRSFMFHYNFPPFSTGEVKPLRGPSRREIGHGLLAQRSIEPVLPEEERFPYTIRVVADILESNGSSSMASVCGASLALMDAGVPIRAPVAGVAMGLVKEGERYTILTDILGDEDHYGDMDFKLAGTYAGITGIQLDLKIEGVPIELLAEAIRRSTEARRQILARMAGTISQPRASISKYAPRISIIRIPKEKIGDVIGAGGRVIRRIIDETKAEIDIDDEGKVVIAATDPEAVEKAQQWVKGIVAEVEVGKVYLGEVKRVTNFGAFVEILPGREGLVRLSQLAPYRVERAEDVVKPGDRIAVRVIEVDELGRINLSRRLEKRPDGRELRSARNRRRE